MIVIYKSSRKMANFLAKIVVVIGILFVNLCLIGSVFSINVQKANAAWLTGYAYRREVTINSSQVSTTTSAFPVLATTTLDSLKTTANGGNVETSNGYDMVWTDSDGSTILNYEVEKYDASTGEIVHWINTDLTAATNKILYLYYGKSGDSDHSNASGVWDTDYQSVWHFNQTSGALLDSTSNSYDSQASQITTQGSATGQIDGADYFDDTIDDYIDAGDVLELDFPISISVWTHPENSTDFDPIVTSNNISTAYTGYWLTVTSNNSMELGYGNGGALSSANRLSRFSSNSSVPQNAWTHVVAVIGSTNAADMHIYINGTLDDYLYSGSASTYDKANASDFVIGKRAPNSNEYAGIMDEVRVSNKVLDANWVQTEYNNQVSVSSFMTIAAEESGNTTPNAPTLVSPANASYTSDDTPTLSANYSDNDTGDTGTTNYRISSSSLADCVSNTNIVATGTSSATASNNEDTTYTPGSSIGSEGTYYWCAQNNDGVATSSWTQMGSFILDTTAPTNVGIDSVTADSSSQITVVANTATDSSAGLNSAPYWFDETSGNSGATDSSSYQASATYVDSGLSPNTQYSYRVKARDAADNESSYSSALSVYTLANVPTSLSLSTSRTQISSAWSANSNPSGTEYYIENTTAGTNSGWTTDTSWTSTGLNCGTAYSFKVKARNADSVETSYSSVVSASTGGCIGGGAPADFYAPISVPDSGWQVAVSNPNSQSSGGVIEISDRYVSLSFNADSSISGISISRYPDFHDGAIQAYSPSIDWDICSSFGGLIKDDVCPAGNYTLYIKFYNSYGRSSESIEQKIYYNPNVESRRYRLIKYPNDPKVYKLENNIKYWIKDADTFNSLGYKWTNIEIISEDKVYPSGSDIGANQTKYNFVSYLSYGSIGQEVRDLQSLLKDLGFFNYPSITGYYGSVTTLAVKDFQVAYNINPLGVVGPQTREKLNSL